MDTRRSNIFHAWLKKSLTWELKLNTMEIMDEIFTLKSVGTKFWTRPRGAELREILNKKIQALSDGAVIVIDLTGVEVFDVSFAAEFFIKTALNLQGIYKGRFVLLEHLEEHCRETLADKLEKEGQIMIERVGSKLKLIGKAAPQYQETLDAIVSAQKPISSSELCDALHINLNAMNERLKKMTNLALIKRKESVSQAGREEFLYSAVA